jgi:transcriptional regulator with XRE-family HTH domain
MLDNGGLEHMDTILKSYPLAMPRLTESSKPCPAVQLLAPLIILTAGTGGVMTAHGAAELSRWAHAPFIHIDRNDTYNVDARSPAEHVLNIRDVFSLRMSDLATVLGVTRPTAYAWMKGDEPKPDAIKRIHRLSQIADDISQVEIPRLDKLIYRPVLNGRSLLDILKTDEDPAEVVALLREIARNEAQTRREPKGSGRHLRSLDEVLSESSVPIYEGS